MRYRQERKKLLWMMALLALCLTGCGKKAAVYDSAAEETVTEGTTAEAADSEEEEAASVWVYVCGEVRTPGVYELPEGSRITDAVEAAGGMTEGAAGTYLNLAETVSDGQKIEDRDNYTFIKADIRDREAIEKIFAENDIDRVVHFAAESHVDRSIVNPEIFVYTPQQIQHQRHAGDKRVVIPHFHHRTQKVRQEIAGKGRHHNQLLPLPRIQKHQYGKQP